MTEYDLKALEEDTRSTRYPGKPFGYEYNMDIDEIEKQMISEGFQRTNLNFTFERSRRYRELISTRLTMKQRQDLAKWLGLGWAGGSKGKSNEFTKDELQYMADKLFGVNDPVGQSILEKIERKL